MGFSQWAIRLKGPSFLTSEGDVWFYALNLFCELYIWRFLGGLLVLSNWPLTVIYSPLMKEKTNMPKSWMYQKQPEIFSTFSQGSFMSNDMWSIWIDIWLNNGFRKINTLKPSKNTNNLHPKSFLALCAHCQFLMNPAEHHLTPLWMCSLHQPISLQLLFMVFSSTLKSPISIPLHLF